MTTITTNVAAEIKRHHELACRRADEAIDHAKQAGKLLLQVKAGMRHGEFTRWLQANVAVSARQAQRYMAAAQGKPLPIRVEAAKPTPMSHLEVDAPRSFPGDPGEPAFVPDVGYCYISADPNGVVYLLEPSAKFPGYFFISRLNADDSSDYTRRPVHAHWAEFNLRFYGMEAPVDARWRVKRSAGVQSAMETLECPAEAAC